MYTTIDMSISELCPNIRKVGKQGRFSWKRRCRKIYDHEFLFCTKGRAYIIIEEKLLEINPGSLVLIKPDVSHTFWQDTKSPANIYWVHFDFSFKKDVYNLESHINEDRLSKLFSGDLPAKDLIRKDPVFENNIVIPEIIKFDNRILLEQLFQKLLFNYKKQDMFWQLECKILLLQVIKIIFEKIAGNMKQFDWLKEKSIYSKATDYISKNYFRKLLNKDISNAIGINEDYLGRIFKKESGMTLTQYINRLRLVKAKELLIYSDLSLTDISEMVGFNDLFYFSKVVKKYEGLPPSRLKNILRNM